MNQSRGMRAADDNDDEFFDGTAVSALLCERTVANSLHFSLLTVHKATLNPNESELMAPAIGSFIRIVGV